MLYAYVLFNYIYSYTIYIIYCLSRIHFTIVKVVQGLPELVLGGLQLGLHGHVNLVQVLVLRTEGFIRMVIFVIYI